MRLPLLYSTLYCLEHHSRFSAQLFKEFSEAKRDLSNLIKAIDEEHQQYQIIFEERKKYLKNLEKRLFSKLENEQREREEMEQRLKCKYIKTRIAKRK